MQEISAVQGGSPRIGGLAEDAAAASFDADDADGEPAGPLQVTRLVSLLAEIPNKDLVALLDAQETETGNTALHIAAFGGCVPLKPKASERNTASASTSSPCRRKASHFHKCTSCSSIVPRLFASSS
jgi:hypothetical protein